jgi:hypothetical protein
MADAALSFEIYHVGIVVTDVDAAMLEMAASLGVTWGRPQLVANLPSGTADGPVFVFSLEGPPYYELIRARPATVWHAPGLHHLGVWCDVLHRAGVEALAAGWQWEQGKYFFSSTGVRYELVPRQTYAPRLRRYLDGGDMFAPCDGPESFQP